MHIKWYYFVKMPSRLKFRLSWKNEINWESRQICCTTHIKVFLFGAFTFILVEKKADKPILVVTLFFKITTKCRLFSWHIISKHSSSRLQVLTNTKKCLVRNFWALWDKKNSCKNRDTPLCIKFFDTRNFQKHETPKGLLNKIFRY